MNTEEMIAILEQAKVHVLLPDGRNSIMQAVGCVNEFELQVNQKKYAPYTLQIAKADIRYLNHRLGEATIYLRKAPEGTRFLFVWLCYADGPDSQPTAIRQECPYGLMTQADLDLIGATGQASAYRQPIGPPEDTGPF